MRSPPDIWSHSNYFHGSKFLVITRKYYEKCINVSAVVIKKSIDYFCGGEVELVKKFYEGSLLVKLKNSSQSLK